MVLAFIYVGVFSKVHGQSLDWEDEETQEETGRVGGWG